MRTGASPVLTAFQGLRCPRRVPPTNIEKTRVTAVVGLARLRRERFGGQPMVGGVGEVATTTEISVECSVGMLVLATDVLGMAGTANSKYSPRHIGG